MIFYFDSFVNGDAMIDTEGVELEGLSAAHREAAVALYDIAKEGMSGDGSVDATVSVRLDNKQPVLSLVMKVVAGQAQS